MRKNIAVILGAGSGTRSGFEIPKQLMKLAGKPIIEHSILAFDKSTYIHEILVVTNAICISEIEQIVLAGNYKKVKGIILGGAERWESSWASIQSLSEKSKFEQINLIFHDAVRPLVDDDIISGVVQSLDQFSAVDVVIPTVDTIVKTDLSGAYIDEIPDRSLLRSGQTPQGFHFEIIQSAYEVALKDPNLKATDDCGIVRKYLPQVQIALTAGKLYNQKLTYSGDLAILEKFFQFKRSPFDQHSPPTDIVGKNKNGVYIIIGGSSGIGEEICKILRSQKCKVYSLSKSNGFDISNAINVESVFEKIYQDEGRIDYIVNCAGILHKSPLASMAYEDIIKSIETNYIGAINVAYLGKKYLEQHKGSLLFFTSSSYTYGRAYYSTYSSSKAAIVNLTQALAEEWAPLGITVNCINPERTHTPMRVKAFGPEPVDSLLSATEVANVSIKVLLCKSTGLIVDVKKH